MLSGPIYSTDAMHMTGYQIFIHQLYNYMTPSKIKRTADSTHNLHLARCFSCTGKDICHSTGWMFQSSFGGNFRAALSVVLLMAEPMRGRTAIWGSMASHESRQAHFKKKSYLRVFCIRLRNPTSGPGCLLDAARNVSFATLKVKAYLRVLAT